PDLRLRLGEIRNVRCRNQDDKMLTGPKPGWVKVAATFGQQRSMKEQRSQPGRLPLQGGDHARSALKFGDKVHYDGGGLRGCCVGWHATVRSGSNGLTHHAENVLGRARSTGNLDRRI